jgi:hypothetical protein
MSRISPSRPRASSTWSTPSTPGASWSLRLTAGYQFQRRDLRVQREMRVSNPGTSLGSRAVRRRGGVQREHPHAPRQRRGWPLPRPRAHLRPALSCSQHPAASCPGRRLAADLQRALADGWTTTARPPALSPSFDSPERSGIDQVRLGLQWSILNQQRDRTYPTWTLSLRVAPPGGLAPPRVPAVFLREHGVPCGQQRPGAAPQRRHRSTGPRPARRARATVARASPAACTASTSRRCSRAAWDTRTLRGLRFPRGVSHPRLALPLHRHALRQLGNFPPIVSSLTVGHRDHPLGEPRDLAALRHRPAHARHLPLPGPRLLAALRRPRHEHLSGPARARVPLQRAQRRMVRASPGARCTSTGSPPRRRTSCSRAAWASPCSRRSFCGSPSAAALAWVSPHAITNTDACNPGHLEPPGGAPRVARRVRVQQRARPAHRPVIDQPGNRFRTTGDMIFDFYASIALTPR